MATENAEPIEKCVLCRKAAASNWSHTCPACRRFWELGRQREKATKTDGKLVCARVIRDMPMTGRFGNPEAEPVVRGVDIVAAMGATKLKGTEDDARWRGRDVDVHIGRPDEKHALSYHPGGAERVEVPKARAEAMARILRAVHDALARERVAGFNEGRDLIGGLARGTLKLETFDEQTDNARAGRQPRSSRF